MDLGVAMVTAMEWFNREHATSYSPSTKEFLFGKFGIDQLSLSDVSFKKLYYCLLFAKYYLTVKNRTKNKSTLVNLSNKLPSNFALKTFHSSISLIFIIHLVHIQLACLQLVFVCAFCACVPCCITLNYCSTIEL